MVQNLQESMTPIKNGFFITFEGGDWCGKTTQITLLSQAFERLGLKHIVTREPGGTNLGCQLRQLIQHGEAMDARTEALLYAADRAYHVHSMIKPFLAEGGIVLCDRYIDSSVAYQGAARALGAEEIRDLSLWATEGLEPQLTILLDGDPQRLRATRSGDSFDRIEQESLDFHYAVREQYQKLLKADSEGRLQIFDAEQAIETLHEQILSVVLAKIKLSGIPVEN